MYVLQIIISKSLWQPHTHAHTEQQPLCNAHRLYRVWNPSERWSQISAWCIDLKMPIFQTHWGVLHFSQKTFSLYFTTVTNIVDLCVMYLVQNSFSGYSGEQNKWPRGTMNNTVICCCVCSSDSTCDVKMCVLMLTKILSLLLIWHQVNKGPVSPIPILLTTLKAPYLCHFPYNNNNSVVYTLNLEDSSLFAYQMTVANASA